ncbi:MAG: hypothetical protein JXR25_08200 [Pontiellaceae bacterium]|nr:hypothetical protein [Pontiellaceae bacterium]MBN2784794.1 hypothetical protein [Pontiellaceae bacterium]
MNDPPRQCPQCGSFQLITHRNSRRVFINHAGEYIPLLTVHFNLNRPILEKETTTYTCNCSWAGGESDLQSWS